MKLLKVWFPAQAEPQVWVMPDDAKRGLRIDPVVLTYRWKDPDGDHDVQINLDLVAAHEVVEEA